MRYARHAVYLARMGYRVPSEYLLERARERAVEFGADLDIVRMDVRRLGLAEVFDGAYMFYTTFGYFSDRENPGVLRGVSRVLRPGGKAPDRRLEQVPGGPQVPVRWREREAQLAESGGYRVLKELRFDIERQARVHKPLPKGRGRGREEGLLREGLQLLRAEENA